MSANRVQVTYTRPEVLSAPIQILSLKNVVGVGVPVASTPSSWMIVGRPQCAPPSRETDTTMPLGASLPPAAGAPRLNTMLP